MYVGSWVGNVASVGMGGLAEMDSGLISAVVPVVITLLGTVIIGLVGGWWRRYSERRSVRYALFAEIQALALIIRERSYLEWLKETVKEFERGDYKDGQTVSMQVSVDPSYCRVYAALTSSLGSLSAGAAQLVVTFYQFIDSVVRDISPGGPIYEGTSKASHFKEAAEILSKALMIAEELQRIEDGGWRLGVKQLFRIEARDKLIRSLRGVGSSYGVE